MIFLKSELQATAPPQKILDKRQRCNKKQQRAKMSTSSHRKIQYINELKHKYNQSRWSVTCNTKMVQIIFSYSILIICQHRQFTNFLEYYRGLSRIET